GAAKNSIVHFELRELLGKYRVRTAMRSNCPQAEPYETVGSLVEARILGTGHRCFFVTHGDTLLGLVTLREIKNLSRDSRDSVTLEEIMIPASRLSSISPSDSLLSAFERMNDEEINQLPVLEEGKLRGILSREDVLRVLGTDLELDTHPRRARSRPERPSDL